MIMRARCKMRQTHRESKTMTGASIIKRGLIGIVTGDFVKAILDVYEDPKHIEKLQKEESVGSPKT